MGRLSDVTDNWGGPTRTYTYDALGRVTHDGRSSITYDGADQTVRFDTGPDYGKFTYDCNHRRFLQWFDDGYICTLYSAAGQHMYRWQASNGISGPIECVYLDGWQVVRIDGWDVTDIDYLHHDHLGSSGCSQRHERQYPLA